MVIIGTKDNRKHMLSKDLSIILENSCNCCYHQYNQTDRAPHTIFPCQHTFCKKCIEQKILQTQQSGQCKVCSQETTLQNIRQSKMSLMMVKIIEQCRKVQQENQKDMKEFKIQIAKRLYNQGQQYFYICSQCKQSYDRVSRLPNMVCYNQHLLCLQCAKKSARFKFCQICSEDKFKNFSEKTLVISVSEFIHLNLFCQTVEFVVNQKLFSLTTYPQTTVKDIFHNLQEFQHISKQLEIKLCKFFIQTPKKTQIEFRKPIGQNIKRIFLQFDQQALVGGSRLTLPSKIVKELPIKINNFSPSNNLNLQDSEIFGELVKPEPSQLYKQKQSQISSKKLGKPPSDYTPNMSKLKPKTIQEDELSRITGDLKSIELNKEDKKKPSHSGNVSNLLNPYPDLSQIVSQLKDQYPDISLSQLRLVQKSKALQQRHQQDFNKRYNLQVKQSKIQDRGETVLPVGSQLDSDSQFFQYINTKLSLNQRPEVLKKFLGIHQVREKDQKFLCYDVYKTMNDPFTREQVQNSLKMEKQIQQKIKKGDFLSLVLILLKKELQDGQIKVIFTPKSTARSQLTLKIITSHVLSDRFIIKQNIVQDGAYYFQKMSEDFGVLQQFIKRQVKKYENNFDLNQQNIVFHNLIKGQKVSQLVFSTNQGYIISKFLKNNVDKDITVHPYFTQLQLSPQDFDIKGQIKFNEVKKDVEFRGKWPYYQPINGQRYGIKVQGKFDKGNNKWLQMANTEGQWAVGFHGLRNPNQAYKHYSNIIQSILYGMHQTKKSKLTVVENLKQAYSTYKCVNKSGELVGDGVYLTPMFVETLPYTTPHKIGDKEYHLVFQCRLRPDEIRIPQEKHTYWVVRHPQAIRPYGIVVIQSKNVNNYPSAQQQFGQQFRFKKKS